MRGRKPESDKHREYDNKEATAEEKMLRKGTEESAEQIKRPKLEVETD